jgi:hypothetical protein
MVKSADFRTMRIPLRQGAGQIPALGFGTLIADPTVTLSATRDVSRITLFDGVTSTVFDGLPTSASRSL